MIQYLTTTMLNTYNENKYIKVANRALAMRQSSSVPQNQAVISPFHCFWEMKKNNLVMLTPT